MATGKLAKIGKLLNFIWISTLITSISALKMNFVLNSLHGEIYSPNYPHHYPLNISFTWTIHKHFGRYLRLTFKDFQVEKAKRCIHDSLQIRDHRAIAWKNVPKHCGNVLPADVLTENSMLQLRFKSDSYDKVDRGFRISWQSEDGKGNRIFEKCKREVEQVKRIQTTCPPLTAIKFLRKKCWDRICDCSSKKDNGVENFSRSGATSSQVDNQHASAPVSASNGARQHGSGCADMHQNLCRGHVTKATDGSSNEKNVAVGIFGALLVIFVIINVILVVFLWKRNKELEHLKNSSVNYASSPGLDWIPCGKPSIHITNSHDSTRTATLTPRSSAPSKSRTSHDTKPLTAVRHYKRREGSPRNHVKRSTIEQQRYFSLLSGIVRTPRSGRRHSGHLEDESYEETSDIYVSSTYPSPTPSHCNDRFVV